MLVLFFSFVVYHLVPTSNHNLYLLSYLLTIVVYHLVPTSNHNRYALINFYYMLFIILFLHQTTTFIYLSLFSFSCLSSCSYIKPQHYSINLSSNVVVYHLVPTSNHNLFYCLFFFDVLFIILFLHQTTTLRQRKEKACSLFIILFLHQTTTASVSRPLTELLFIILFLHQTTTAALGRSSDVELFIILFLHQTTTNGNDVSMNDKLFIILFLHQTTTIGFSVLSFRSCLSSCSYIKPQRFSPAR